MAAISITETGADELAAAAAAWAAAPQEGIARTCAPAYRTLVERLGVAHVGESWIDVATGTGPLARVAAAAGAGVVAFDFAPELVELGRRLAAEAGYGVRFAVHSIENHRYVPEEFQVVASAFGAMYAADHRLAAKRLAMLCHPAGRIGLLAWEPGGWMAEAHALLASQPGALPHGEDSPFRWGDSAYVGDLFGDEFELTAESVDVPLVVGGGEEAWELFVMQDGPTHAVATAMSITDRDRLERSFVDLAAEFLHEGAISRPALLTIGRRRS
jgi:hypothetical protein